MSTFLAGIISGICVFGSIDDGLKTYTIEVDKPAIGQINVIPGGTAIVLDASDGVTHSLLLSESREMLVIRFPNGQIEHGTTLELNEAYDGGFVEREGNCTWKTGDS